MRIRRAAPADAAALDALLRRCFPGGPEPALVGALTGGGHVEIALLAEEAEPVGCAVFSRMARPMASLGLGPVATDPARRRRGIASALVAEGLEQARSEGWAGVFVLGEPGFYGRFGFSAATARDWRSPYAGPYFMAVELRPGALRGGGEAAYAAPFAAL